ncbi:MAG: TIM barrel protein [Candidatus Pacearchaeota archaeon]
MVEKKEYKTSDLYQGGYSSLDPEKGYGYGFVGTHIPAGQFALTTDPRNANWLQEMSSKLSTGVKHIELEGVSPEVFESIPQQHLKEINRLSKLTGVDVTVHGPLIEASGFTKEGWSETGRQAAERQMKFAVERAHEINPDGNSPIVFHSSAILPGQIKPKRGEVEEGLMINPETGSINRISLKERNFPGEESKEIKNEIKKQNEQTWRSSLSHLAYNTERAGEFIESTKYLRLGAKAEKEAGKELLPEEKKALSNYNIGTAFLNDSYRELKELYNLAYNNATHEDKPKLDALKKEIESKVTKINELPQDSLRRVELTKEILASGLETLNNRISIPEIYKPLDEFAKEKTIKTFANVAWDSYEKVREGKWKAAPIIAIENPPAGGAFSRGHELKEIVEKARDEFVKIGREKGLSESEAKSQAEKLIGVTWDVGHINMMRKYGYESKDIVEETEKIKPLLKHIHLSDNFGFEHTELPMGMGNVPIKEMMEKLGKEGFEAKKVIEAASWWQHFKSPPVQESLEAFGSPIYSMKMAPYWNQSTGFQQGYFSGYGTMLPQGNYNIFGAGFSQLPSELGGQTPGQQGSRLSGNRME